VSLFDSRPPGLLLTIAGHDPSSGAGITADLATFAAHGFFGLSAITALTVQSTLGVVDVQPADAAFLRRTLDYLTADLPPAGIKIGMLGSAEIVSTVASFLKELPSPRPVIVLDPVIAASSGAPLLGPDGLTILRRELLPAVGWITPNFKELELLGDVFVASDSGTEDALRSLADRYPHLHIVATGGDADDAAATDHLLTPGGQLHTFTGERIASAATHGTGCAFSSALLAHLVRGEEPAAAVAGAKGFVAEAIRTAPGIGHGKGPLKLRRQVSRE
jgi:hydroxymethylpyrimidine/phosphomethylpyrimidine kinase